MSNYDKVMKWHKTHRKGVPNNYMGFDTGIHIEEPHFTKEQEKELEKLSFERISNNTELAYPIYLACSKNYYYLTQENDFFGTKINNKDELIQFYNDYVK